MKESTFAQRLKIFIEKENVTWGEVAGKTGIAVLTLDDAINGRKPLSALEIAKFADAFGIDARYFFEEDNEKAMAYLIKDGPDQAAMKIKAFCLDYIFGMYSQGYKDIEIYVAVGLIRDLVNELIKTAKDA